MQELHLIQGEHKHLVIVCLSDDTAQWHITQEADSVLTIHMFCLDKGEETDCDVLLDINQVGEHAETYIYGLGVISGKQQIKVHTHVRHSVPNGKSNQLLKFAVKDNARAEFVGELIVAPNAQHSDARQTNRNVLLSPTATMHTQPQLEIYADDVKCGLHHAGHDGVLVSHVVGEVKSLESRAALVQGDDFFPSSVLAAVIDEKHKTVSRDFVLGDEAVKKGVKTVGRGVEHLFFVVAGRYDGKLDHEWVAWDGWALRRCACWMANGV